MVALHNLWGDRKTFEAKGLTRMRDDRQRRGERIRKRFMTDMNNLFDVYHTNALKLHETPQDLYCSSHSESSGGMSMWSVLARNDEAVQKEVKSERIKIMQMK